MESTTGHGALGRMRTLWRQMPPQRRSALVSLAVLCGLMTALLAYPRAAQAPRPERSEPPGLGALQPPPGPEAVPSSAGQAPAGPGPAASGPLSDAPAQEAAARPGPPADTAPLDYPLKGKVILGFGWAPLPDSRDWRLHPGIDIAGAPGDAVVAAAAGTVTAVIADPLLGRTVVLDHGNGRTTRYAGLEEVSLQPGARVERGQVIGRLAPPAPAEAAAGPHLHFVVEVAGEPADPLQHMNR